MRNTYIALALGLSLAFTSAAQAKLTPLAVAIFPPAQFPPSDFHVAGLRLSALWGKHQGVKGFDLGVAGNITTHDFAGVSAAGLFNFNQGESTVLALQAAGLTNVSTGKLRVIGIQIAGIANVVRGEAFLLGIQASLVNYSPHMTVGGFQVGLFNRARTVSGFQIGVINSTEDLHGLQIGLLNFHAKGLFPVSPGLNFGF
jgi:hypothetical protein